MNRRLLLLLLFTAVTATGFAQSDSVINRNIRALESYTDAKPIEKVHLHLDRQLYFPGDTIWFKAYVVLGAEHKLSALSGILYAELISPKDTVIKRLNLELNAGTAPGDFELPFNVEPGTYRIRAYTNWMRNFGSEYFFDQPITVSSFSTALAPVQAAAGKLGGPPVPGKIDLQFFPEGGDLVNGLRSKVAFKAINQNGMAEEVQGSIVDDAGIEVATFASQHLGMGDFPLEPEPGKQYLAKVTAADGSRYTVPLPPAGTTGYTLTVNNSPGDSLHIKVAAKNVADTAFYLLAQHGGKYDYAASGKVTNKPFIAAIPKRRFATGIEQFTLFSQSGEPLNERVVFIQNDDQLHLTLTTDKQTYAPGEEVKLSLEVKDNKGNPVAGTFSVAVVDESKVPVDELNQGNIFADLLLKSEISGPIGQPNYYFINPNDTTKGNLDLLMLTQGYRRFEWKKILTGSDTAMAYKPEQGFTISGHVTTPAGKAIPKGEVILTSPRNHLLVDTLTDELGKFVFDNIMLRDTATIIINSKKANGGSNVKTIIDKPQYPPVNSYSVLPGTTNGVDQQLQVSAQQIQLAYKSWKQDSLGHVILLKEVTVKDHKIPPIHPDYAKLLKYSANLNGAGNANQVIMADETFLRYRSLLDALQSKILGVKIVLDKFGRGVPFSDRAISRHLTGQLKPMAIYVDGIEADPNYLCTINPGDVYSVEVLTSAQYLNLYGTDATSGAIIVTLKNGSEILSNVEKESGMVKLNYIGTYKYREFYSPRYASKDIVVHHDDYKCTIYWVNKLHTDQQGHAGLHYFNMTDKRNYLITIEGIDSSGRITWQILNDEKRIDN